MSKFKPPPWRQQDESVLQDRRKRSNILRGLLRHAQAWLTRLRLPILFPCNVNAFSCLPPQMLKAMQTHWASGTQIVGPELCVPVTLSSGGPSAVFHAGVSLPWFTDTSRPFSVSSLVGQVGEGHLPLAAADLKGLAASDRSSFLCFLAIVKHRRLCGFSSSSTLLPA